MADMIECLQGGVRGSGTEFSQRSHCQARPGRGRLAGSPSTPPPGCLSLPHKSMIASKMIYVTATPCIQAKERSLAQGRPAAVLERAGIHQQLLANEQDIRQHLLANEQEHRPISRHDAGVGGAAQESSMVIREAEREAASILQQARAEADSITAAAREQAERIIG